VIGVAEIISVQLTGDKAVESDGMWTKLKLSGNEKRAKVITY
jgi:hypothetical protein